MQEIKSVRIDNNINSFNTLFKATLYRIDSDNFKVIFYKGSKSNVYTYINSLYPQIKKDLFFKGDNIVSGFKELGQFDYFINEAIINQSRIDSIEYVITQDPFMESKNKRRFSLDPYYLNNGAIIYINWFENNQVIDASDFSDENGNELVVNMAVRKSGIEKKVQILYQTDSFTITDENIIEKDLGNRKKYSGMVLDKLIIEQIINLWKSRVLNYDLKLCDNQSSSCTEIDYFSPIETKEVMEVVTEPIVKKKIQVGILNNSIKVRDNLSIKINLV